MYEIYVAKTFNTFFGSNSKASNIIRLTENLYVQKYCCQLFSFCRMENRTYVCARKVMRLLLIFEIMFVAWQIIQYLYLKIANNVWNKIQTKLDTTRKKSNEDKKFITTQNAFASRMWKSPSVIMIVVIIIICEKKKKHYTYCVEWHQNTEYDVLQVTSLFVTFFRHTCYDDRVVSSFGPLYSMAVFVTNIIFSYFFLWENAIVHFKSWSFS